MVWIAGREKLKQVNLALNILCIKGTDKICAFYYVIFAHLAP